MKKLIYLSFAFALVIGLTQCKKRIETIQSVPDGVYITLEVEGGDKAIVDPTGGGNYATVEFEAGDVILVGNNGKYCGSLEHNGTKFEGRVSPTSADDTDYLHFYFQGNDKRFSFWTSYSYIPDQAERYRVVSYGRSTYLYNKNTTSYTATLQNYCAIVKFNITGVHPDTLVTITGMNNRVQIDFSKNIGSGDPVNPFVYSKIGDGDIRLHNEGNGERWAILLPQDQVDDATAYAVGYHSTGTFSVPAVRANGYYDSGVSVDMAPHSPLNNGFSVNSWGKQVVFSPGNLQATYDGSSWSWHFAPNQWSYIGDAPGNTIRTAQAPWISGPGTVDLFRLSLTNTDYGIGIQPVSLAGYFVDWGTNAIGSDAAGTWRTPDMFEWNYLFGNDYSIYGSYNYNDPHFVPNRIDKVALATVNGTPGMVLLPDTWTLPAGCTFTPVPLQSNGQYNYMPKKDGYDSNIYDAATWALMEANGAVFLPAAGIWYGYYIPDYMSDDRKPSGLYSISTIVYDVDFKLTGHNVLIAPRGFSGSGDGAASVTYNNEGRYMSVRLIRYAW